MLASNLHCTAFPYCHQKFEMFPFILGWLNFLEGLIETYMTILIITGTQAIWKECNHS